MTFKECSVCGEQMIIWDIKDGKCIDNCLASYFKHVGISLHAPEATDVQRQRVIAAALALCKSAGTAKQAAVALRRLDFRVTSGGNITYSKPEAPQPPAAHHVAKSLGNYVGRLSEKYGFTQPEDGSEDRYTARSARQSPARHAFWWWVHNAIAHPLIGVMPRRFAFEFHDWTSRKLHGA